MCLIFVYTFFLQQIEHIALKMEFCEEKNLPILLANMQQ